MRYIDIARKHGFGLEDITEDKTGEKPAEVTEPDTSVKDADDLAATAKEGADAKPEGDSPVTTDDAAAVKATADLEAAATKDADAEQVGDTVVTEGKGEQQEPAVAGSSDEINPATESADDKVKEETTDEKIEAVKKKLDAVANTLEKFAKDNQKEEKASTEETVEDVIDTAAEGAVVEGEAASVDPVVTGDDTSLVNPVSVSTDENLVVSNEGFAGAVVGFILGGVPLANLAFSASAKATVEANKKEIDRLSKELKKLATEEGRKLVKEGKISEKDLTNYVTKLDPYDFVTGVLFGTLFGPFHGLFAGSAMEDTEKELKKKVKEIEDIVKDIKRNQDVPSKEEHSGDANLVISNEGFSGYLKGFLVGSVMPWKGGKYKGELEAKKKELDHISEQIAKLSTEEGKKLLKEGKIKESEFNKKFDVDPDDVKRGVIRGWFLGGYYGGAVSSKLQNVTEDYEKKVKELDALLKEAAKEEKVSTEEHSGDLEDVAVSAPLEENDTDADAGVIAKNADAEMISEKEDMEHAGKELAEAVETVAVMEKTQASVEAYYEVANYSASRRGIDRSHAISIGIGLESILEDFGIDVSKVVPSLESFGLEEEKKETTKKFAAKLKDIIAAIMRALVKAYEVVIEKSQELINRAKHWNPGLKTAIKLTKSTLAKGEVKDSITVPVSVRRALYIGKDGEVSIASLTDNAAASTCAILIELNEAIKNSGKLAKDAFISFMNSSPESAISSLKNSIGQNELSLKPGSTTIPKDFIAPDGYTVLSGTEELPGGKLILTMAPKKEDGGFDYSKMISGIKQVRPEDSITEPTTISNVTKEDMENVINTVENIVSSLDKLVSARQSSIALYKGIVSAMENYGKSMDKDFKGTEEQAAEIKDLLTYNTELCKANIKLASTNIDAGIAYIMKGVTAPILDLVRASVKKPSKAE